MLEIKKINTFYNTLQVLREVSFNVGDSKIVALLGRNGMGKTTTVHSIIGFNPPRNGSIKYDGQEIIGWPPFKISRLGIGLVPQGHRVFPSLTVEENLLLGFQGKRGSLDMVYTYFPRLQERACNCGSNLSGGEQQMLSIARVLLAKPKLILMDEPSEGLAPQIIHTIGDIILDLKRQGISVLLVEQNITLAMRVSDYCYVMQNGRVVHDCETEKFSSNYKLQDQLIGIARLRKN